MHLPTRRTVRNVLIRAVAAAALLQIALASPGSVSIADRPGLPPFGTIQQAIDAALDGETLIVGSGVYGSFHIENRKLAILSASNASVTVNGTTTIENVGPQRSVVLAGLRFVGASSFPTSSPGLELDGNTGSVWLVNCIATGGVGVFQQPAFIIGAGGDAVVVRDCARVAMARCLLFAGDGGSDSNPFADGTIGGRGGIALRSQMSSVVLYSSTARGGDGGNGGARGGDGGDGVDLVGSGSYFGGGFANGGNGGQTLDFLVYDGANGGHGVDADVNSQARFVQQSLSGGSAGICHFCDVDGLPGSPSSGAGLFDFYAGAARTFFGARIVGDGELWAVQFLGVPGDFAFVAEADEPEFAATQPVLGVTLVAPPANLRTAYVGRIPANGVLNATVRLPVLAIGESARTRFTQGLVLDANGRRWQATPVVRTQLE